MVFIHLGKKFKSNNYNLKLFFLNRSNNWYWSFCCCKIARHVFTQKEVAVKVIDKTKLDEISKAHLFQEVMCMKLVQHPNVVRLYEVIDTPNKLYLILEFGDGGDMYDYIMKHANGLNETISTKIFSTNMSST